jgi:excisionase family DNA binding protein
MEVTLTPEPLLDCKRAAIVLGGVHPKTVERWAREGRIPAYRLFRKWRFRMSELEVWMRSHVNSDCHPCRVNEEDSDGT